MADIDFFTCTKSIPIGHGISYRLHKHWGMNVWAGEGLFEKDGDRSGCLLRSNKTPIHSALCCRPIVVFQRIYSKGAKAISAILSYPNGMAMYGEYFWEIYPTKDGDIERFFGNDAENKMENKIIEYLKGRDEPDTTAGKG